MCSFAEKLTLPESVGTLWNFCITAASFDPTSEPFARLIAVTSPSIAAGPVTKPPVAASNGLAALSLFASAFTAGFGSCPNAFA